MKKNILVSIALCVIFLFSTVFANEYQTTWKDTQISVSFTAEEGISTPLMATPIEDATMHAFWIQLENNIDTENLVLEISNPSFSQYSFEPASGTKLSDIQDANGSLDGDFKQIKVIDEHLNIIDTINLYFSVMPAPSINSVIQPGEDPEIQPGADNEIPIEEPIVEPSAEEPFTSAPEPAKLIVKYIDSLNGKQIVADTTEIISQVGENYVYPKHTNIDGYKLVGDAEQKVYFYDDGMLDPSEVYFNYEAINVEELPVEEPPINEEPALEQPVAEELANNSEEAGETAEEPTGTDEEPSTPNNEKEEAQEQPSEPITNSVELYAKSISSVNIRKSASTKADIITQVPTEAYIYVESLQSDSDGKQWAKVSYKKYRGYLVSDFINILSKEESDAYASGTTSTQTEPTDTMATTEFVYENERYATTNAKVNLRSSASKDNNIITSIPSNEYIWVNGVQTDASGVQWASVIHNGKEGFIVSSFLNLLSQEQSDTYQAAQPSPVPSGSILPTNPEVEPAIINSSLRVQYIDINNVILYQYDESYTKVGSFNVEVKPVNEIVGYELQGEISQSVKVDEKGTVSPALLTFMFKKTEFNAKLRIHYTDNEGTKIAEDTEKYFNQEGEYIVEPDSNHVGEGYKLVEPVSYSVNVSDSGELIPLDIVFKYKKAQVQAELTIDYFDTNGNKIADSTNQIINTVGKTTVVPNISITDTYKISGQSSFEVELTQEGQIIPSTIAFVYEKQVINKSATLIINYIDNNAKQIVASTTKTINTLGETTVFPETAIPEGYRLKSEPSHKVNFSEMGVLSPQEVSFVYEKEAVVPQPPQKVEATVLVSYVDEEFNKLAEDTVQVISILGANKIVPQRSFNGYILKNPNASVNLASNGVATPSEVIFQYKYDTSQNVKAVVGINYLDQNGNKVANSSQQEISNIGNNSIIASPNALPSNYQLVGNNKQNVVLSTNGSINPTVVNFIYKNTNEDFEHYSGYALTDKQTALRTQPSTSDSTISTMLQRNTLVYIAGQTKQGGVLYHSVSTLQGKGGFIQDGDITKISQNEAQKYINEYYATINNQNQATATPTVQSQTGYAVTLGMNVPLRAVASAYSGILENLPSGIVVFVNGIEYRENTAWYIAQYNNKWGYIRHDQLRMLNNQETQQYLNSLTNTKPTPSPNPQQYNQNTLSSYGYINSDRVNFRSGSNTTSSRIGVINKYAFALILETKQEGNKTWYKINYNRKEGYVSGDFFKVMTIKEMQEFLSSPNYALGIKNNSPAIASETNSSNSSNQPNINPGISAPGNVSSLEDYNANKWKNPNLLNVSYEPFSPYTTPAPSGIPNEEPTATPTMIPLGTMIPTDYSTEGLEADGIKNEGDIATEKTQSSSPFIFIALLMLVAAGGAIAYTVIMKNKRKKMEYEARMRRQQEGQRIPQQGPNVQSATPKDPYANPTTYGRSNPMARPNQAPQQRANSQVPNNVALGQMQSPFAQRKPLNDEVFKRPQSQAPFNIDELKNMPSNYNDQSEGQTTGDDKQVITNFDENKPRRRR